MSQLLRLPRAGFIVGIPAFAFALTIGFSLATGGGDEKNAATPTVQVVVQQNQTTPTAVATTAPTAVPHRTNCSEIQGTAYRSDAEREWYIRNCSGGGATTAASGGGGTGAPAASRPTAAEVALGDRLVIPKIGVNAPVSRMAVPSSGVMPDPTGYFNVVLYDFSALPGLGGTPASGNAVLAGHVDCGRCGPGGTPSIAVLYYMRNLVPGDTIEYYTQAGQVYRYVVTFAGDYSPSADWGSIVASSAADITIITCTGTFSGGEYSLRRVVQARKA
ncbi:MAG TPA: class F sortase [Dehalococcoidia bacterium]|nr:class F sortase [Dehalococcoidia bacterium]